MEPTPLAITPTGREVSGAEPRRRFASWLQGAALGAIVLAVAWAALSVQKRPDPSNDGPIELKRGIEILPNSTMKIYGLHLPRAGRLVVDATSETGEVFSVYLVGLQTGRAAGHGNELRMVEAFTAERVAQYSRGTWVEPGAYHLTLVNSAPSEGGRELSLRMLVRLDP